MFCIAGDDLPVDDRRLTRAMRGLGVADEVIVRNDTFAVLRAGTDRQWGVGVVCGTGLNCAAVSPSGRTVRYAALGQISGDEGGGGWMGEMALATAVRSRDGRGPKSLLERAVPDHFGLRAPLAVTEAIHTGKVEKRPADPAAAAGHALRGRGRCALAARWSSTSPTRWPGWCGRRSGACA